MIGCRVAHRPFQRLTCPIFDPCDCFTWIHLGNAVKAYIYVPWCACVCVRYFSIKPLKGKQLPGRAMFSGNPACGTCQIHFTPSLPAWPIPHSPPNCKLRIYRPTEPRWFPAIAARGIIMNARLPAHPWMRFLAGFLLQAVKPCYTVPHHLRGLATLQLGCIVSCSKQPVNPFSHSILESWLFLHCPMRLFDWSLLIIIAFQNPDSCSHSCNFLSPLIGKTSSGEWGIFIESIFGGDYFVNWQDEAHSREVTHWNPPHEQDPDVSPSSHTDQQIPRDPRAETKGHTKEGPFRSV